MAKTFVQTGRLGLGSGLVFFRFKFDAKFGAGKNAKIVCTCTAQIFLINNVVRLSKRAW